MVQGGEGGGVVSHSIHLHGSSPEHSDYMWNSGICGIVDTGVRDSAYRRIFV